MADIKLTDVSKFFGDVRVLHDINLQIEKGEFIVFVGPSGCGKSTLLRVIAGLETISSGTLEIDGQAMNDIPPSQRGVAMVFQSYALYPHMTVFDNIAFALRLAKLGKQEIDTEVRKVAELLQLTPYLDRLPKALSGGQRQRVAIGRTIVRNPRVFLFDEPLSNLDAKLRVSMRIQIANLNDSLPDATMIYVTHDQVEAMTLADRIVVLSADGGIEQIGEPLDLYENPTNLFVARFIGSPAMNIIPAQLIEASNETIIEINKAKRIVLPFGVGKEFEGQKVHFGVRPEDLVITESSDYLLEGKVAYREALGDLSLLYLQIGDGDDLVVVKSPGTVNGHTDDTVRVNASMEKRYLFDDTGASFERNCLESRFDPGQSKF